MLNGRRSEFGSMSVFSESCQRAGLSQFVLCSTPFHSIPSAFRGVALTGGSVVSSKRNNDACRDSSWKQSAGPDIITILLLIAIRQLKASQHHPFSLFSSSSLDFFQNELRNCPFRRRDAVHHLKGRARSMMSRGCYISVSARSA